MPHPNFAEKQSQRPGRKLPKDIAPKGDSRYTVALAPSIAHLVEKYAQATGISMSKAIAALVRMGLEGQQHRKREFFEKLRANLANEDPNREDQLIDEFRSLILGR